MADDFDAIETGNEPKGRRGWLYVDDTGKEQGPYSTEKLRGWVAQGYLTASRVVRPFTSLPTDAKPLSEWSELAHGGAGAKKARARWKMARRVVSLAALHAKSMQDDSALVGLTRAQQQRYARSSFGFDALLLRMPHFAGRPPAEWSSALLDALVCIVDTAVADLLAHIVGHYNGANLGHEAMVEVVAVAFWFMRPDDPRGLRRSAWARARARVRRQWALMMRSCACGGASSRWAASPGRQLWRNSAPILQLF